MPRYYFHVRWPGRKDDDPTGMWLADDAAARSRLILRLCCCRSRRAPATAITLSTPIVQPQSRRRRKSRRSRRLCLNLQGRFGLFVSALKIPFPRNGDFGSKRPVRMRCR